MIVNSVVDPASAVQRSAHAANNPFYRDKALRAKKVLTFLRANPNSTNDEIFNATGFGIGSVPTEYYSCTSEKDPTNPKKRIQRYSAR